MIIAAFGPNDEITAIFQLIAVIAWVLAALSAGVAGRFAGGSTSLVGLGLAFWFFPAMWNTLERAF
jgi:hypothetical protein